MTFSEFLNGEKFTIFDYLFFAYSWMNISKGCINTDKIACVILENKMT